VSTARMAFHHVPWDCPLQFRERSRLGGMVGEERAVNILPIVPPGPPHHDFPALFVPFENRPRTHAQPAAHLGRY